MPNNFDTMKTKLILAMLMIGYTATLQAQNFLFNGGFETWQDNGGYSEPSYWYTLNALSQFGFEKSTILSEASHSGQYAALLLTQESSMQNIPGLLASGPILDENANVDFSKIKVAFNGRPQSISFFYKYIPGINDSCNAYMALTHWNDSTNQTDTIAEAIFSTKDTVSEYREAIVTFQYRSNEIPDSAFAIFTSSFDGFDPVPGSAFYLDDFRINFSTGLKTIHTAVLDASVYPNPTNDVFSIDTKEPVVDLTIVNTFGQRVLSEKGYLTKNPLAIGNLSSGVYFITIASPRGATTVKLIKQ